MNATKLAAIAAMLIAGQALGQTSQITYKLELSHGATANNRTAWKSTPCADQPLFDTSGASSANGLSYSGVLTWDARVFVAGSHATGTPQGVANVVFTLELKDNNGALVAAGKATNSTDSPGIPGATTGYYSTINDNTNPGSCHATDGNEGAAFAVYVSSPDPQYVGHGRLIDTAPGFGPGFDYFQYPSCGENANYPTGFPAGAGFQGGANANGVKPGQLAGMGAGYSKFIGTGCPGGGNCGLTSNLYSAGVGTAPACGLGSAPVAEGQINLAGLAAGTYTLSLVPGTGNNILKGDIACGTDGDVGDFAVAPDLATQGASVIFIVPGPGGTCPPGSRTIAARGIGYANSCYDGTGNGCTAAQCAGIVGHTCTINDAIDPTKTAHATGAGAATIANYVNYSRGINLVTVDINHAAGCTPLAPTAGMFTFTNDNLADPTTAAPAPSSVTTAALSATQDRVYIRWADNALGNHKWLKVVVKSEANGGIPSLAANDSFYWGLAIGESNTPDTATPKRAQVTATDEGDARTHPQTLPRLTLSAPNALYDYDKSAQVVAADQGVSRLNPATLTALRLFVR